MTSGTLVETDTVVAPAAGVGGLWAAVHALAGADLVRLSPQGLLDTVRQVEAARRAMAAVDHRLIDELYTRGLAGELGYRSTAALLSAVLRLSPGEAKARVTAAADLGPGHSLTGEWLPARYPVLAAAQADGVVSPAHAAVITRAIAAIPAAVSREVEGFLEQTLTEQAAHRHPDNLATAARHLLDRIDPDGVLADEHDHTRRRELTITGNRDGSATLTGRLTPSCAEKLHTVLDALAKPAPATPGSAAAVTATTAAGAAAGTGTRGQRDPRSAGQRRHDALDAILDRLLRSGSLPDSGGIPATVLITMTLDQYRHTTGLATTGHGNLLSINTALHLADQARVVTVVADPRAGIVATYTTSRVATTTQRLALTARDRGCSFPDCDTPPAWTQAHHVIEWSQGRPTTLGNMTLLCGHHHRTFQAAGWQCQMTNGAPHWIPPAHIDPTRTPRTNTTHNLAPPG